MEFQWSNKMGARQRNAWLIIVHKGEAQLFLGKDIPGVLLIKGSTYEKNGKWSHTTYRLEIRGTTVAIQGKQGWNNDTLAEGLQSALHLDKPLDTWEDFAEALGITVEATERFLRRDRPKVAASLDASRQKQEEFWG